MTMWMDRWKRYDACERCEAKAGRPCIDMRWRNAHPYGFRWTLVAHPHRPKVTA